MGANRAKCAITWDEVGHSKTNSSSKRAKLSEEKWKVIIIYFCKRWCETHICAPIELCYRPRSSPRFSVWCVLQSQRGIMRSQISLDYQFLIWMLEGWHSQDENSDVLFQGSSCDNIDIRIHKNCPWTMNWWACLVRVGVSPFIIIIIASCKEKMVTHMQYVCKSRRIHDYPLAWMRIEESSQRYD